jgi:hypothetical protein
MWTRFWMTPRDRSFVYAVRRGASLRTCLDVLSAPSWPRISFGNTVRLLP